MVFAILMPATSQAKNIACEHVETMVIVTVLNYLAIPYIIMTRLRLLVEMQYSLRITLNAWRTLRHD